MPPETVPVTNFAFINHGPSYPSFEDIRPGTFFRFADDNVVMIKLSELTAACIVSGFVDSYGGKRPVRVCRKVTVEG